MKKRVSAAVKLRGQLDLPGGRNILASLWSTAVYSGERVPILFSVMLGNHLQQTSLRAVSECLLQLVTSFSCLSCLKRWQGESVTEYIWPGTLSFRRLLFFERSGCCEVFFRRTVRSAPW